VLLVHAAVDDTGFDITWRQRWSVLRKPPLGLLYLAAALRPLGLDPRVVDSAVTPLDDAGLIALVRRLDPLFVGFGCTSVSAPVVHGWLRALRRAFPELPLVVGGPGTVQPRPLLEAGAELAFRGEADRSLPIWVQGLLDGQGSGGGPAPGTVLLRDGALVDGGLPPRIDDLDSLPMPAVDLLPVSAYHDRQIPGLRTPYFTVVSSRGCRFGCSFCASRSHWGRHHRQRSPGHLVREIEALIEHHGVRYVGFHDDLFAHDDDWVAEFSERMDRLPRTPRWGAMVHPASFERAGLVKLRQLRRSGCDLLVFGLQSAEPGVLRGIHRSTREPALLVELCDQARRLGITTKIEYIFGLPGEAPDADERALEHAIAAGPNTVKFFRLLVFEGTELAALAASGDWTPPGDRALDERCARAMRRFYTHPAVVARNLRFIARHHPGWPLRMAPHAGFLLEAAGLRGLVGAPARSAWRELGR